MTGYIGIGGTAKKVKNIYVGVGGVAKKVKKGYIGVNGVARLWYTLRKVLSYYGTATNLQETRYSSAGASVGNYALFYGGIISSGSTSRTVDAYSASLIHSLPSASLGAKKNPTGLSFGDYALFHGAVKYMYAYDADLVMQSITALTNSEVDEGVACVGGYALFAGGDNNGDTTTYYNSVDVYDSELVKYTATALSYKRDTVGVGLDSYAIFAGGYNGSSRNYADAYSATIVKTTVSNLPAAKFNHAGARAGDYALFAGGNSANTVIAYDDTLVQTAATSLSDNRRSLAGGSIGEYAVFAGGMPTNSLSSAVDIVEVYDGELVKTENTSLSVARVYLASANAGNYILFAGGNTSGARSAVVDVYQLL